MHFLRLRLCSLLTCLPGLTMTRSAEGTCGLPPALSSALRSLHRHPAQAGMLEVFGIVGVGGILGLLIGPKYQVPLQTLMATTVDQFSRILFRHRESFDVHTQGGGLKAWAARAAFSLGDVPPVKIVCMGSRAHRCKPTPCSTGVIFSSWSGYC